MLRAKAIYHANTWTDTITTFNYPKMYQRKVSPFFRKKNIFIVTIFFKIFILLR